MKNQFQNVLYIPRDWRKTGVKNRNKSVQRQLIENKPVPKHIQELRSLLKLMPVGEVASYLGVTIWTVYEWIKDHGLECQRIGRIIRISTYALADFLEAQNT